MSFDSKEELIQEFSKCYKDSCYAIRTYLETYDNTQQRFVPFDLFPDQENLIADYESSNENIVVKYRQAGVSTVTSAWVSKKLAFASDKKPEKILIIANKLDTSIEFANKIRSFISQWPEWLEIGFDKKKDSQSWFKLSNKCEVKAVATSVDALRGYTPSVLIFDEAAYIDAGDEFWSACMASLSTGGKVIVISTPNGYDKIYYEIYDQSIRGVNDFKVSTLFWYTDPRFTKDLVWVKCNDIVHYMLNREQYDDKEVVLEEKDKTKYADLFKKGYLPYSSWFETMSKKLKYDRRLISQEIEGNFLGSGDNVIPPDVIKELKEKHICDPLEKYFAQQAWIWKEPQAGKKYIMGIDVSRGDSEDYSAINIIDFDDREQVFEFQGKIPPDELAELAFKWGMIYSAYIVVDITGGMGVPTSRRLQEMGFKDLYVDGVSQSSWKYDSKIFEKIPGINFNSKRTQIIAALEEALRHGFIIHSSRMISEFNTFVYINGKADHMKGHHDDLIMSIAMSIYVGETSFSQLKKVDQQTRAMLESYTVNERKTSHQLPTGVSNNPFITSPNFSPNVQAGATREAYEQYSWLFNKRR